MAKKVAVLVVNPVNGLGLFHYLEAFFEHHIPYTTFAVAETNRVMSNSGLPIETHDVIANLQGWEGEFDALVFACGDAMPNFSANINQPYNQAMLAVIKTFSNQGKILAGHCAAGLVFDKLGIGAGRVVASHPLVKTALKNCVGTDAKFAVDGKLYTAQTEHTLDSLIPELLSALQ